MINQMKLSTKKIFSNVISLIKSFVLKLERESKRQHVAHGYQLIAIYLWLVITLDILHSLTTEMEILTMHINFLRKKFVQ